MSAIDHCRHKIAETIVNKWVDIGCLSDSNRPSMEERDAESQPITVTRTCYSHPWARISGRSPCGQEHAYAI